MGKKDGRGTIIWVDGSIYEGYWKADKMDYRGRIIYAEGDYFHGEWKNG